MKLNSLHELYVTELRDLYDAENRIIKALPKMAKAASSPELKDRFEERLTVRTYARRPGYQDYECLLAETLEEEGQTDKELNQAGRILHQSGSEGSQIWDQFPQ